MSKKPSSSANSKGKGPERPEPVRPEPSVRQTDNISSSRVGQLHAGAPQGQAAFRRGLGGYYPPADVPATPQEQFSAGNSWVQRSAQTNSAIGVFTVTISSSSDGTSVPTSLTQEQRRSFERIQAVDLLFGQCSPEEISEILSHLSRKYRVSLRPEASVSQQGAPLVSIAQYSEDDETSFMDRAQSIDASLYSAPPAGGHAPTGTQRGPTQFVTRPSMRDLGYGNAFAGPSLTSLDYLYSLKAPASSIQSKSLPSTPLARVGMPRPFEHPEPRESSSEEDEDNEDIDDKPEDDQGPLDRQQDTSHGQQGGGKCRHGCTKGRTPPPQCPRHGRDDCDVCLDRILPCPHGIMIFNSPPLLKTSKSSPALFKSGGKTSAYSMKFLKIGTAWKRFLGESSALNQPPGPAEASSSRLSPPPVPQSQEQEPVQENVAPVRQRRPNESWCPRNPQQNRGHLPRQIAGSRVPMNCALCGKHMWVYGNDVPELAQSVASCSHDAITVHQPEYIEE